MGKLADDWKRKYDADVAVLMHHLASFIDAEFGQRCDTFLEECPTCKLWDMHDRLFQVIK